MQNRYLSAKIGMSESQVAGEDGEDNGGSLDHRLVLAEEARAALANELEVLKQAFETEVCGLQAELESEKLRSQMAGKAYQDAIIALSENTTETMVEISKYEEIQRALEEQRARAQESDTRARDLALKNDELSGNYTILMNELAATREQLEEKAVDAHQKGLEIEKLQEIIAGDRGNTGETRELFEAVSRSVYVTDDDRAALVAGVNESIQLSMAARSMCINASSFEGASMRSLQLNTSLPPAGDNAGTNTSMQVGLMTDVGLAPSFLRSQSTSLCNSTDPDALQSSFCGRRVRPRQTTLLRNVGMEASMQCTTPEQSADGSVRSNLVQSHTVRAAIGEAEGERVQQLASICIGPSFVEHDGAQASLVYNNSKYYDEEMFNLARTRIIELESELDALKARLAEGEALTQGMRTTLELVDGQAGPDGEARMDAFIVLMRENSRIKGENESLLACVESLQAENARLKKELADACAERGSLRVLLDQQSNPRPISTASIHSTALLEMRRSLHGRDSVSLSNSHTVPEPPASPGVSRLSMSGAKRRFVDFMPYIDTNTALSVTMVDRDVLDGEALRNTELMRAVIRGDVMGVSAYLGQAKMRNANGRTALMLAAEVNNVDAAFKLAELEGGIATPDGETALRIALEHYNIEIASLLVAWEGIDMRGIVATNYTKTELMGAAERADLVSAFCLMRTQAGLQDRRGRTAMMYAAERGHYRIVRLLVRAEAGLQDVSGESALMIAARHGHIKVCRLLAAREAGLVGSPDPLLAKNQTALMLACFYGHLEVVRLLYAAERDIQSQNGKTAYQYARYPSSTVPYETQQQIVAYLEEAAAATY
ncbi:Ankyrin repeat protein 1 [Giardia muris]|nr:Ankyrin repeat protein 1 [Giardia muris]|eukprot:TNJ27752.1 Ankyrin repeat protein 1 [Giardia muris]